MKNVEVQEEEEEEEGGPNTSAVIRQVKCEHAFIIL